MANSQTVETIFGQIKDSSVRMVAECALLNSKKALDMPPQTRIKHVADEIDKIMPKALKVRENQ